MPSKYPQFDRSLLTLRPLNERQHDLSLDCIRSLVPVACKQKEFHVVADRIHSAVHGGNAVVLMMGAHVLRAGVQPYLISLMEKGLISCIAVNGAGVIHDFEFALIGATTESVSHYIKKGRFGLWQETGRINEIIIQGSRGGLGLGESVGKVIEEEGFPHKEISILAAGYRLNIPITVHIGVGYDIIHEHPNCDGAALGDTSYRDFLIFTQVLDRLARGVVMNFGSAVMAPEVYLKALAMVRNVAARENREIFGFTSLVCDLANLPEACSAEPCRTDPRYYFRPWKTMLSRTMADGGESFYIRGDHAKTIPQLWSACVARKSI
ncbi:MAG: hypothetical protein KKF12_06425 [Proteobacteria bacterium]|nr:hypothetical protein [Desulfobacula sp.]MBU4130435.1 hypothetical protein [Pseudomonadota bacterium]